MQKLIKAEEILMFLLSVGAFAQLDYPWWLFFVLILVPDIGMLGYLLNSRIGAITYNIFHHKGIAIIVYVLGVFAHQPLLALAGLILFGHASMDRIFGYGLKYTDSFKNTHLGTIGKS